MSGTGEFNDLNAILTLLSPRSLDLTSLCYARSRKSTNTFGCFRLSHDSKLRMRNVSTLQKVDVPLCSSRIVPGCCRSPLCLRWRLCFQTAVNGSCLDCAVAQRIFACFSRVLENYINRQPLFIVGSHAVALGYIASSRWQRRWALVPSAVGVGEVRADCVEVARSWVAGPVGRAWWELRSITAESVSVWSPRCA